MTKSCTPVLICLQILHLINSIILQAKHYFYENLHSIRCFWRKIGTQCFSKLFSWYFNCIIWELLVNTENNSVKLSWNTVSIVIVTGFLKIQVFSCSYSTPSLQEWPYLPEVFALSFPEWLPELNILHPHCMIFFLFSPTGL